MTGTNAVATHQLVPSRCRPVPRRHRAGRYRQIARDLARLPCASSRPSAGRHTAGRRRVLVAGIATYAFFKVGTVALGRLITSAYFDGNWWMLAALATAVVAYAPAHLARGVCAGTGRFGSYAFILGSDGVIRIVACLVLALFDVTAAPPYAFAVALSPLIAVGVVAAGGSSRRSRTRRLVE